MSKALLELYLAGRNATQDKLEELKEQGVVVQFALRELATKKVTLTSVYAQRPSNYDAASGGHQLQSLVTQQLPLVLFGMGLFPSPKTAYYNIKEPLVTSNNTRFVEQIPTDSLSNILYTMSTSRKGYFDVGVVGDNMEFMPIIKAAVDLLNKEIIRDLVAVDEQEPITNPLPLTNFRFIGDDIDRGQIERVRTELSRINKLKPTTLSHWILMPAEFYNSEHGLERAALNAFRHGSKASSYREFSNDAVRIAHQLKTHKTLHKALGLIANADKLRKYIERNEEYLSHMIHNEVMAMKSASKALNVTHYSKTLFNIAFTKQGWMKSSAFEWSTYTDLDYHKDFNNSLFDSVLPEITAHTINKNPLNRVANVTSLISNFNLREVPINAVYSQRFKTPEDNKLLEQEWDMASIAPSSISLHHTTISDRPLFEGFFEGIPSVDQEKYSAYMYELMQGEKGAKLSGCQFKLPVTLTEADGHQHLKRQRGSEPFTHIAKMPHQEQEMLTLSEWLSLRILKDAGLNVAKNQLVAYTNPHADLGQQTDSKSPTLSAEPNTEGWDDDDKLFHEIGQAFEKLMYKNKQTAQQEKSAKVPPFLISERFDIGYESDSEHRFKKITSIDLGAICSVAFSEKYKPSLELVAERMKSMLPHHQIDDIFENMYEQIIASCLLHNNDLHVKNMTILATEDTRTGHVHYEMSPIYDVLITPMVFPSIDKRALYSQALSIDGTKCPSKEQIVQFGIQHLGMSNEKALRIFDALESRVMKAVLNLKDDLPSELTKNALWKDALESGLLMVQRNIRHLQANGKTYGHFDYRDLKISHSM